MTTVTGPNSEPIPTEETLKHLSPETIPEAGYKLAKGEAVYVTLGESVNKPKSGTFFEGSDHPVDFKDLVRIQMGSPDESLLLDVVVMEGYYKGVASEGARGEEPVMGFIDTGYDPATATPMPFRERGYVVGRATLDYAVSTVSWTHLKLTGLEQGRALIIENLHPTNDTILFPIAREEEVPEVPEDEGAPKTPDDLLAATRAIDMETGENVAGPTVNARKPWEIVNPRTGIALHDAGEKARRQAVERHEASYSRRPPQSQQRSR